MDAKRVIFSMTLLLPLYLPMASADTTNEPDGSVPIAPAQAPAATPATDTTAEVWNKGKVLIKVSQTGVPAQTIEPGQSYKSRSYPDAPLNIQLPENTSTRYITVTGKKGACSVQTCVYVQ
ncbi:MAG: hypothetical protein ABWZ65_15510 [Pseudomonas mandelii]